MMTYTDVKRILRIEQREDTFMGYIRISVYIPSLDKQLQFLLSEDLIVGLDIPSYIKYKIVKSFELETIMGDDIDITK